MEQVPVQKQTSSSKVSTLFSKFSYLIFGLTGLMGMFFLTLSFPDLLHNWTLFAGMVLWLGLLLSMFFVVWAKQGFIKVYWGRTLFGITGIIFVLLVKLGLDSASLNNLGLVDVLTSGSMPINTIVWAFIVALLAIILYINILKVDLDRLLRSFQLVVVGLVTLSALMVMYALGFSKHILANGGLLNYFFKGVILTINNVPSLQAVLSMLFGGSGLATVMFLVVSFYWLSKWYSAETKKFKLLYFFIASIWLVLSLLVALRSIEILVLWFVSFVLFSFVLLYKFESTLTKKNKLMYFMFSVLFGLLVLVFVFILSHINILQGFKAVFALLLSPIGALTGWLKILGKASLLTSAVDQKVGLIKLILFGFNYGTALQVLGASSIVGLKASSSVLLVYLLNLGLVGLIGILFTVLMLIKILVTKKEVNPLVYALIPVVLYPLFVVPSALGWFVVVFVLILWFVTLFDVELVTLGLYKLGSGSRKAQNVLYIMAFAVLAILMVKMSLWFRFLSDYHYAVRYQSKWQTRLYDLTANYISAKQKGSTDPVKSLSADKIKEFKDLFATALYYGHKVQLECNECEVYKLYDYQQNNTLLDVAVSASDLYSALVSAPNTEGINQFVTSLYSLQKNATMPISYKLLGDGWQRLSTVQKTPLFLTRAIMNYDKYIWYAPFDTQVLGSYLNILFSNLQLAIQNKSGADAIKGLQSRIESLLQLYQQASIQTFTNTGNIDALITNASYKAKYYMIIGDKSKAVKAYDEVIDLVSKANISDENKQKLLDLVNKVKESVVNPKVPTEQTSTIKTENTNTESTTGSNETNDTTQESTNTTDNTVENTGN